jgi:16S rRNA (guanine527-N7)-methyltransferase
MSLTRPGSGFQSRVERVLAELGGMPSPDAELVARFAELLDLTVEWNEKFDLTAARDADELCDLLVADAALVHRHHGISASERWVDVGSGAGAPGLPLALLLPNAHLTLVEPKQKRVAFLRTAIGRLGLHVEVKRARSEELEARSFDVAISRATLPPEAWLKEGTRGARSAAWMLLARAEPPLGAALSVDVDERYTWPLTGVPRRALRYVP